MNQVSRFYPRSSHRVEHGARASEGPALPPHPGAAQDQCSEVKRKSIKCSEKKLDFRFRYQCEGRGAGALQGERSTLERKSYPRVQICNYKVREKEFIIYNQLWMYFGDRGVT